MRIRRLLNFSTHPGDPELFDDDWGRAEAFLKRWAFDGFELYPVGNYPFERIPGRLVAGIHLRFFVILAPLWREDHRRLMEIFGDRETATSFYGAPYKKLGAEWVTDFYAGQLNLAQRLGCDYVVFHPVHCELAHVYDWRFPWKTEETLDMCAEIVNAATARSNFNGRILFENLWWPGSFRLLDAGEYDYLRSRIHYPKCGIALDTGHLLNTNPDLASEAEAVAFLMNHIDSLGSAAMDIRTVHLTRSLSGGHIRRSRKDGRPCGHDGAFWEQFDAARRHVGKIDRHEPFAIPDIARVLERLEPEDVVFEFTFFGIDQWEEKIATQKKAVGDLLWPKKNPTEIVTTTLRESS